MKEENTFKFCGSITKTESLIAITKNISENSWVAEANLPYANYYGKMPEKIKANTLFLFTKAYYTLEEVLRFSQGFNNCYAKIIDVASAILVFQNKQYPAIRVKNFQNYEHLYLLQKCFQLQGVEFAQKVHFLNEAKAVINKCFEMKKLDEGIYFDQQESNKGYLFIKNRLDLVNFHDALIKLKNNSNCRYFDAVPGVFIHNSQAKDFIRIYSKGLNLEILKCIKNQFEKNNIIEN